jgi:hypothetical protein
MDSNYKADVSSLADSKWGARFTEQEEIPVPAIRFFLPACGPLASGLYSTRGMPRVCACERERFR